ncbi:hypothetical protein TNCV_2615681 [Trichonephila clavipes]|nr:hypothetical protein TNCV_2615681 [Trichonephila clavipes]
MVLDLSNGFFADSVSPSLRVHRRFYLKVWLPPQALSIVFEDEKKTNVEVLLRGCDLEFGIFFEFKYRGACRRRPFSYAARGHGPLSTPHATPLIGYFPSVALSIGSIDIQDPPEYSRRVHFFFSCRLGGMVGLLLVFGTQGCGFDPGPSR